PRRRSRRSRWSHRWWREPARVGSRNVRDWGQPCLVLLGVKSGPFVEVLFRMMDTMGVRWSSARPVRGPRRDHRSHYNRVDPTWATNGTNEETGPDGGEAGNRRSAVRGEGVPPARGGRRRGTGDVPQRALPGRRAASADDPSPAAHPRGARV